MNPRVKSYLVLALVLTCGAAAGAGAGYGYAQHRCAKLLSGEREPRRAAALARELELTDEQQRRIREIMAQHRVERRRAMGEMFDDCGAPVRAAKEKLDQDIRGVLGAEQRTRYDELVREQHRRFPWGRPGRHQHRRDRPGR